MKAFTKHKLRSITQSIARFLSILLITALGVGIYAGINATQYDMELSGKEYFEREQLSDLRAISPLGYKDEDIENLKEHEAVRDIDFGYMADLFLRDTENVNHVVRAFSCGDDKHLSTSEVIEGRMPEAPNEIAIDKQGIVGDMLTIGDSVRLIADDPDNNPLKIDSATIVGIVNNPVYLTFERDYTNIGTGRVDFNIYLLTENFDLEHYNLADMLIAGTEDLWPFEDDCKELINVKRDTVDEIGVAAVKRDTDEFVEEINDRKQELADGKQELNDELAKAKQDLDDAEKEIREGWDNLKTERETRTKELDDAQAQISDGWTQYASGKNAYNKGVEELEQSKREYTAKGKELEEARAELDRQKAQLEASEAELKAAGEQLAPVYEQIEGLETLIAAHEEFKAGLPDLPRYNAELIAQLIKSASAFNPELAEFIRAAITTETENPGDVIGAQVDDILATLNGNLTTLKEQTAEQRAAYENGLKQLEEGKQKLAEAEAAYEEGKQAYDAGGARIAEAEAELERNRVLLLQTETDLVNAQGEVDDGRAELDKALKEAEEKLIDAEEDLEDGKLEYVKEKAKGENELYDADMKIRDAERDLLELPSSWIVNSRENYPGYTSYSSDAERIGAVAKIFPIFFFFVAALVCLTTMTRMVEEERGMVGILKALGYSNAAISWKYITYALVATLAGSLIGASVGVYVFPYVITKSYSILYHMSTFHLIYNLKYTGIAIAMQLILTVAATFYAIANELRSSPAKLMQPRAPKPGKRILLERFTFLWKRLSFSHKVTARNIFRYKARMLMTVAGIAGCTALILAGFGIDDSVKDIRRLQFDEVWHYDGMVTLKSDNEAATEELTPYMEDSDIITEYLPIRSEQIEVEVNPETGRRVKTTLYVIPDLPDDDEIRPFIDLHVREGENLELNVEGAYITEKLAREMGLEPGDPFTVINNDGYEYTVNFINETENYFGDIVYMNEETFSNMTLRDPVRNAFLFNTVDKSEYDPVKFQEDLMENKDQVVAVTLIERIIESVDQLMQSLDSIVIVLVAAAGLLAFVVLFNLTNINVTERIREIATIKVLGFHDTEVSMYILRENMILTVMGALVGLVLGVFLHRYIMTTMEVDAAMFGKHIHTASYFIAFFMTLFFSLLTNIFTHFSLKKVSMVESLKSVD